MTQETNPRLREAYAIIDGIPDDRFDLRHFANSDDPHDCGTIACAAGWLAMHPKFNALGLTLTGKGAEFSCLTPQSQTRTSPMDAIAQVLRRPRFEAGQLFGSRNHPKYEPEGSENMTDKQLWQARVRELLEAT